MYVPEKFQVDDLDELFAFVAANAFGQLVSLHDGRPVVTHLPFLVADDRKTLRCHVARQNPQWQQIENQPVLATFLGPHDYISPSWYTGAGVPTWNYQAAHVYGRCRVFDDADELAALVDALSGVYEARFESPWQPRYPDSMLKAIVGIELAIDDIQGKYKLSQNRPAADHAPVMEQLEELGSDALVTAMRKALQPSAE
jgi:transcriptional regulator